MQKSTENPLSESSEYNQLSTNIPENYQWIAESAYFKALARSFTPDYDLADWLEAKKDYEEMLSKQRKNGLVSLGATQDSG